MPRNPFPRHSRPTPYAEDPANAEVRALRAKLGITKVAYGRLLGKTDAHIAALEGGTYPVPHSTLLLVRLLAERAETARPIVPWLPGTVDPADLEPPAASLPAPAPDSHGIHLTPGDTCGWHSERCRPPVWHFAARLDAGHHLEGECCRHHLGVLYAQVIQHLREHAARPRQRRQPPAYALSEEA